MRIFQRSAIGLAVMSVLLGSTLIHGTGSSHATTCSGPQSYSWSGTVISYGVRDFTVPFCGPDSLDALVSAHWSGNKKLGVQLVEPDGTIHTYVGNGSASGQLAGPLASGNWTVIVRNLTSSNVRFSTGLTFE